MSILEKTNEEIINEVRSILGYDVTDPTTALKSTWGRIVKNASEYVKDGVVDIEKLETIYSDGDLIDYYIATLAITSLRNRPDSLFNAIKNLKATDKVLDYGCGSGTHGIACAEKGCEVYAVDVSKKMKDFTKARYKLYNLPVKIRSSKQKLPKNYFDFIICVDLIEHIPEPIELLRKLIGCLKQGGVLYIYGSAQVMYEKGHLPKSISLYKKVSPKIFSKRFKKVGPNSWKLL